MDELPTSATGYADAFLPPGDMRDEIMRIIRIGKPFREQHVGRKPGFLHGYICEVVANMKEPPTFANLLAELDLAATRRDSGDDSSPIERVSRSWEQLIYHRGPRSGEVQITFKTLRNYFTAAKQARNK